MLFMSEKNIPKAAWSEKWSRSEIWAMLIFEVRSRESRFHQEKLVHIANH